MSRNQPKSLTHKAWVGVFSLTTSLAAILLASHPASANWQPLFRSSQYFGTGTQWPVSLAIADFDGNMRPDLVVGTLKSGLGVLLHTQDPRSFQMFPSAPPGGTGQNVLFNDVATADFDLDGRPDLVSCVGSPDLDAFKGSILVWLRTSQGFAPPKVYAVGGARRVATGDVNGDGRPDVVVGAFLGPATEVGIRVMLSVSGDSLAPPVGYYAGSSGDWQTDPRALTLADATGDGILDAVLAVRLMVEQPTRVIIFQGSPSGTFSTALPPVVIDEATSSVVVAQLNGDAIPDLAVVSGSLNRVSVHFGTGGGAFQAPVHHFVAITPGAVCAGDIDGDGDQDLVATTKDPANVLASVGVLRNNGNGTFAAAAVHAGLPGTGEAALSDMDLDGRLDLVAVTQGGDFNLETTLGGGFDARTHSVGVLLNDGTGAFRGGVSSTIDFPSLAEAVGDFNRDGVLDLVTGTASDVNLSLGLGNGAFGAPSFIGTSSGAVQRLLVGDLNRDGLLDVVVASAFGNTLLVASPFGFVAQPSPLIGSAVALLDMNRDGLLDILTHASSTNELIPNICGSPTLLFYTQFPSVAVTTGVNAVAVGDWDRDGTLDVATAGGNGIGKFRGVPTGHLLSQTPILMGRAYTALCAADLTNDGWLDLAGRLDGTVPGAPGTIDVHKNSGGSFSLATTLRTLELRGGTIAAADVNVDGKLDLIASGGSEAVNSSYRNTSFDVLLNGGNATFAMQAAYALAAFPASTSPTRSFAIGDLDRNSVPDIVAPTGASATAIHSVLATPPAKMATLREATFYPSLTNPNAVALGDLNRDGKPDVVAAKFGANPGVAVLLGDGNGALGTSTTLAQSWNTGCLGLADFNRDGILDIAASNVGFGSPRVSTMLGAGDGTFGPRNDYFIFAGLDFDIGDMNRDGIDDIVTAVQDSIRVLFGTGSGTFTAGPGVLVAGGTTTQDVDLADLNRDGYLDVAVAKGVVKVIYGGASGTLGAPVTLSAPLTSCTALAVGDLNRDGFLDVVANSGIVYYVIWGASASPFSTYATTTLVFTAYDMKVGEAEANGKPFIYASGVDRVAVLSVSPLGALGVVGSYTVNASADRFALGDLDRDGLIDVVSIGFEVPSVAVNLHGLSTVTGIEATAPATPRVSLRQNYPNPFNPRTTIRYALPRSERVQLRVFDVRGRLVATLRDGAEPAGERHVEWDGRDRDGRPVSSGVYLYRLTTESGGSESKRMVVVK